MYDAGQVYQSDKRRMVLASRNEDGTLAYQSLRGGLRWDLFQ